MGKDNVWALNLGAGYANGDMSLSQRFSVGGSDVLRGYRDDQFKGNSMVKGSLEFRYPIIKKVQGVFFTDTGYAWSKEYDESNFDLGKMKNSVGISGSTPRWVPSSWTMATGWKAATVVAASISASAVSSDKQIA